MCTSAQLTLSLGTGQGAAGSYYVPIEFANTSSEACWLYGYPGVSAWDGHEQLGVPASRDSSAGSPVTVVLQPGASTSALLRITDAGNYPTATCQPAQATSIRVFVPQFYTAVVIPHAFEACTSDTVIMSVRPVGVSAN